MNILRFDSKADAIFQLKRAIMQNNWQNYFCKNDENEISTYFFDKETVSFFAEAFTTGGFYNKEQMFELMQQILIYNIEKIADWLLSSARMLELHFTFPEQIGYIIENESGKTFPTRHVNISFMRDHKGYTEFGFFVSYFCPAAH